MNYLSKETRQQNKILLALDESNFQNSKIFICDKCLCYVVKEYQYQLLRETGQTVTDTFIPTNCIFCSSGTSHHTFLITNLVEDYKRDILMMPKQLKNLHPLLSIIRCLYLMFPPDIYTTAINGKPIYNETYYTSWTSIRSFLDETLSKDGEIVIQILNENDCVIHTMQIN